MNREDLKDREEETLRNCRQLFFEVFAVQFSSNRLRPGGLLRPPALRVEAHCHRMSKFVHEFEQK